MIQLIISSLTSDALIHKWCFRVIRIIILYYNSMWFLQMIFPNVPLTVTYTHLERTHRGMYTQPVDIVER